jgi:hypothetical protein
MKFGLGKCARISVQSDKVHRKTMEDYIKGLE